MRGAVLLLAAVGAAAQANPFAPGQYNVSNKKGYTDDDVKWSYDAFLPQAQGKFPVMLYVTGLGGTVPGSTYSELAATMAAKGTVVIVLSRNAPPQPQTNAKLLGLAIPWFQQNAAKIFDATDGTADFDRLVLSAHSAGNHVWCDYLQDECGIVKAVVMMDPVDGFDPFGIVDNYCITPGKKVNFSTPALMLRTGLDPKAKAIFEPACAPDKLSNDRFYDAWAGPVWEVNATAYGHLDVNDKGIQKLGTLVCPGDNEDKDAYFLHVAGLVNAFFSMVFDGQADAEKVLTTPNATPAAANGGAQAAHNYNGATAPFKAGCTHP